jgi:hypothetical protein
MELLSLSGGFNPMMMGGMGGPGGLPGFIWLRAVHLSA